MASSHRSPILGKSQTMQCVLLICCCVASHPKTLLFKTATVLSAQNSAGIWAGLSWAVLLYVVSARIFYEVAIRAGFTGLWPMRLVWCSAVAILNSYSFWKSGTYVFILHWASQIMSVVWVHQMVDDNGTSRKVSFTNLGSWQGWLGGWDLSHPLCMASLGFFARVNIPYENGKISDHKA